MPTDRRPTVRLADETITQDQLESVASWMISGTRLTKGEETVALEQEFARHLGAGHAVYVNSGSSANLLMALALLESGRLRNRTVICPAISWVTTVSPFLQLGFDVHLCDADPEGLGLDPSHLSELLERCDASLVVTVDVLGHPNRYAEIAAICAERGAILIEDACEALGTIDAEGAQLGTKGVMGSFSFYYGHHLSTIEGGMVVTDDAELHQLLLSMRSHGWSRDLSPDFRESLTTEWAVDDFSSLYTFFFPGLNFRSTDLQARIGRLQLASFAGVPEVRQSLFRRYGEHLTDFWSQTSDAQLLSAFAYGTTVVDRAQVGSDLLAAGIETRPLICGNIARHPFWLKRRPPQDLPVADVIHEHGIYLPIHAGLSTEDVDRVVSEIARIARPGPDPRSRVGARRLRSSGPAR